MFLVWSLKRRAVTSVTLATSYSLGLVVPFGWIFKNSQVVTDHKNN